MQFFEYLLDIILPKKCVSCSRECYYVCPECFAKIPTQTDFHCFVCGQRSPGGKICPECHKKTGINLTGLLVASDWQNLLVRQLIYECKYRFVKELAQPLALILAKFLTINGIIPWPATPTHKLTNFQTNKLTLIPIPLHRRRENWRGFNQAKIICDHLTKYLDIATLDNLILRGRHTPPQMDIKDKIEREKNVVSAFKLNPDFANKNLIENKIIFLIDDVCTTGSTLKECAAVLKELKPKEIWGLVIARG